MPLAPFPLPPSRVKVDVSDFQVCGEQMVRVLAGPHLSGQMRMYFNPNESFRDTRKYALPPDNRLAHLWGDLGMTFGPVTISPTYYQRSIGADALGQGEAECVYDQCHVDIQLQLVHYHKRRVELCMLESMGGSTQGVEPLPATAGVPFGAFVPRAGVTLGRGKQLYASGCHWMGLVITPPLAPRYDADVLLGRSTLANADARDWAKSLIGSGAWYFPAARLVDRPVEIPLGTAASVLQMNWRAITYPHTFQALNRLTETSTSGVWPWYRSMEFYSSTFSGTIYSYHEDITNLGVDGTLGYRV